MAKVRQTENAWTMVMRWTARVLALGAVGLFVAFVAVSGSTVLPALSWSNPQGIPLLIVLFLALVGVVIAWRWEMIGGLMAVAGALGIMGLVCLGSGGDMLLCAVFFTLPILVAGVLYLGCCWRTRATTVS